MRTDDRPTEATAGTAPLTAPTLDHGVDCRPDEALPPDTSRIGDLADFAAHTQILTNESSKPPQPAGPVPAIGAFGNYELLAEIARGGMGVVFKARQINLNRIVAVKMILAGQLASKMAVQRFYAEAQAAANLHHPSIVGVYEVGEIDGRHFFSMEFVEGESLADRVRLKPLPPADAARYMVQIAEAIAHAHELGILHRDLKPSNVLIDKTDRARVTDFGLAKQLEGTTQLTGADTLLGTPSYMPPEQAAAQHGNVDRTSDVYSLGAVLYELLTGRPPFVAAQPIEIIFQVLRSEPAAPRLLVPTVPVDLETIALKCLAKEQSKRYQTAGDLAADLGRWIAGEPILARPTGQVERMARWCRRNPRVAFFAGTSLLLLIAFAVVSTVAAVQIRAAHNRALQNLIAEEAAKTVAQQNAKVARKVVEKLVGSFTDTMTDLGSLNEAQRRMLEEAKQVYEDFLRVEQTDPTLKFEAALARRKLGDIARLQGRPEDFAAAEDAYDDSIRRFQEIARADPTKAEYRRELAESWNGLGELLRPTRRVVDAEAAYRKAIDLQRRAAVEFTDWPDLRGDVGRSLYNLGILHRDNGDFAKAQSDFDAAIAGYRNLVAEFPDRLEFRHGLGRSLDNLGILYIRLKDPAKAEAAYRDAVVVFRELVDQQPKRPDFRAELAGSQMNLSNVLAATPSRLNEAEAHCRQAKELFDKLAKEFRVRTVYRQNLAKAWESLGQIEWKCGRRESARDCWLAAVAGFSELVEEQPNVVDHRVQLGGDLDNLAYYSAMANDAAQKAKAAGYLAEAHRRLLEALAIQPGNPKTRDQLLRHAQILLLTGDVAAAAGAAATLEKSPSDSPGECEGLLRIHARCLAHSMKVGADSKEAAAYAKAAARTTERLARIDAARLSILKRDEFAALRQRPEFAQWSAPEKPAPSLPAKSGKR